LLVAWSDHGGNDFQIRSRRFRGGQWSQARSVSSETHEAFRPEFAVASSGKVWLLWDRFDGSRYNVAGRRVLPESGPLEQVSPAGQRCLSPTALAMDNGLYVAWLRKEDVIGGPGVISQWHTLQAATRQQDEWKMVSDRSRRSAGAELTQGLVAKIQPRAAATGGCLGRCTQPMLVADGNDVWLLWERKADHRGSTSDVVGDLLGRCIRNGAWQDPVTLTTGQLDYHLVHSPPDQGGKFALLASDLPQYATSLSPVGWRPVSGEFLSTGGVGRLETGEPADCGRVD
jgi:hypothetical protein